MATKVKTIFSTLIFFLVFSANFTQKAKGAVVQQQEFTEYKGSILSSDEGDPIASAQLSLINTNIATVTNAEGEFSLKVPEEITSSAMVRISYFGYGSRVIPISDFLSEGTEILLNPSVEELEQVSIYEATDPEKLIRSMLAKRGETFLDQDSRMTGFYRETIRKGRKNVSLSEAVLHIHKKAYGTGGREPIELIKARKTADYDKLDTLALKLRGGPYNTLFVDVMKYPDYLFYQDDISHYTFSFDQPIQMDGRHLYVVNFEDRNREHPWYFGQFYIDAETHSLVKAILNLNVDNRSMASSMFVSKKPGRTKVYPIEVQYQIDYQQQNGKWFYAYGSANLTFVVNWKRKLFNSRYHVHSEMAITHWERPSDDSNPRRNPGYIRPTVVMADDVSGFSDPNFWGSNNIIEPDKSIQNAIDKIENRLK